MLCRWPSIRQRSLKCGAAGRIAFAAENRILQRGLPGAAVEEMIEVIHAEGKEMPHPLGKKAFSGKFVLRVEPAIHRRLAAKALAAGESLNSYCVKALVKA